MPNDAKGKSEQERKPSHQQDLQRDWMQEGKGTRGVFPGEIRLDDESSS